MNITSSMLSYKYDMPVGTFYGKARKFENVA